MGGVAAMQAYRPVVAGLLLPWTIRYVLTQVKRAPWKGGVELGVGIEFKPAGLHIRVALKVCPLQSA